MILYLPAMSGAGALLEFELLDVLLLVFLLELVLLFELVEVEVVVDLHPITTPSNNTNAIIAGCRDVAICTELNRVK